MPTTTRERRTTRRRPPTHDWSDWFGPLDAESAARLEQSALAEIVCQRHIPGWWAQTIVESQRAPKRPLRG
jgi:hypothetical protein